MNYTINRICSILLLFSSFATPTKAINYGLKPLKFIRGEPVVTSPYLGERSYFESFDYITFIPPVNQDFRLLEQLQKAQNIFASNGLSFPSEPILDLSGKVMAQASWMRQYDDTNRSEINLIAAELHGVARVNTWGNVFFNIIYDNKHLRRSFRRTDNSRFYLEQGFISLGNFNEMPFYLTLGQLYMPFGLHTSFMLTAPLTAVLGKVKERAIILGFRQGNKEGFHAAIFGFKGNIKSKNQGGAQIDYRFDRSTANGKFGVGFITHLAEANGFQSTGDFVFPGFSAFDENVNNVPGIDIHAKIKSGNFDLTAELVLATKKFNSYNLQFGSKGAKPLAMHLEGEYNFKNFTKSPMGLALAYDFSMESLALNIPKHRLSAALLMSWWRSTLQIIEIRHDINYAKGSIASGMRSQVYTGVLGKSQTALTFHMGYYF